MWNERIQHDTTQNMWSWFDVILNHLIWYGTKWNVVICYGAIWNVIGHSVHTTCLINNMKSTKSAYVMSFCMLRRRYINGTVCACHIMKLFIPGASPNWPDWQAYVKIWANMTVRAQSNNQTCGVLKTWLARKKLHKLRTRHTNWHRLVLLPYVDSVDALHCCTLSATLFVVFLFWLSCSKQYPHRPLPPPGKTCRWWPSSQVFRWRFRHWAFWFSQPGQKRSAPWIQSLQHTQHFLGSVPGRPRRMPCRPRSDPILHGWHIEPLNNTHRSAKQHFISCILNHQLEIICSSFCHSVRTNISTVFNGCSWNKYLIVGKTYVNISEKKKKTYDR